MLIEVANRLRGIVRDSDTVARLGGDEFVVLVAGLGTDAERAGRYAESVVEKIRSGLCAEYGPVGPSDVAPCAADVSRAPQVDLPARLTTIHPRPLSQRHRHVLIGAEPNWSPRDSFPGAGRRCPPAASNVRRSRADRERLSTTCSEEDILNPWTHRGNGFPRVAIFGA